MSVFPPPVPVPVPPREQVRPRRSSADWWWPAVVSVAVLVGIGGFRLAKPDAAVSEPETAEMVAATWVVVDASTPEGPGGVVPGLGDAATATSAVPTVPPSSTTPVCSSQFGWTLTVPPGWYESGCQLFAPWPITETDPTISDAPVQVVYLDGTWEEVIVAAAAEDRQVVAQGDITVAGRRALAVSSVQVEPGWFDTGTAMYEIWVDDGGRVVILTAWAADGDLSWLTPVVDELAASLAL